MIKYCSKSNRVQLVEVNIYSNSFSESVQSVDNFLLYSNNCQPPYLPPIWDGEYTDCISAERLDPPNEYPDMT